MNQVADALLAAGLKRKDEGSFELLYHKYAGILHKIIVSTIGRQHEQNADDLLQETFMRIWRGIDCYDSDRGPLDYWLKRVTVNISIDYTRINKRQKSLRDQLYYLASDRHVSEKEIYRKLDVRKLLSWLSNDELTIIILKYYRGYTQGQMAKILDVPLGTIKSRDRAIIKKLRSEADPGDLKMLNTTSKIFSRYKASGNHTACKYYGAFFG